MKEERLYKYGRSSFLCENLYIYIVKLSVCLYYFLKFAINYKNSNTTKLNQKRQIEKVKEKLLHTCENNDIILVKYLYL